MSSQKFVHSSSSAAAGPGPAPAPFTLVAGLHRTRNESSDASQREASISKLRLACVVEISPEPRWDLFTLPDGKLAGRDLVAAVFVFVFVAIATIVVVA